MRILDISDITFIMYYCICVKSGSYYLTVGKMIKDDTSNKQGFGILELIATNRETRNREEKYQKT